MTYEPNLLAVFAHPDDESLGTGGTLAKYATRGAQIHLLTATRGELGWFGAPEDNPGPEALGQIREAELRDAARVLGIGEVSFLDYRDGELEDEDQRVLVARVAAHIRRVRPQVVLTFDPYGLYGHPDHIAISAATTAAVAAATTPSGDTEGHIVSKLYYMAWTTETIGMFERAFGELVMNIRGKERRPVAWPSWAVTTRVDASSHWRTAWEAVACHRSQLPGYDSLLNLPPDFHEEWWRNQTYYRAMSRVNSQLTENDLFDGIWPSRQTWAA